MKLATPTAPGKSMTTAGQSTPRGVAIIHGTSAPAVLVLRSEFHGPRVHIIGAARRISVLAGGLSDGASQRMPGASFDLQYEDLGAVRDLIDALETALAEATIDPMQTSLEVAS